MKGPARILIVEPLDEFRAIECRLLGDVPATRAVEVCASYEEAASVLERVGPDLVLLGLDADVERALELLRQLATSRPGLAVLPASCSHDGDLILRSVRAGAREFLTLPTTAQEIQAAIARLLHPAVPGGGKASRCVAVVGATGGVGCTTLALNLAATVARDSGQKTALVDFDLMLGAVDACLDIVADQTLADLARDVERLDPTLLERSLVRHASGLHVLPGPRTIDEAMKLEPAALQAVLERLLEVFPLVFVDLSKGFHASDSLALERADVILLTILLEPVCVRNSARLLDLFRQYDGLAEKVHVVANRVGAGAYEIGTKKAAEILKQPVAWEIVEAAKLCEVARSKGVTLDAEGAGSRPHRAIVSMARALFPDLFEPDTKRGRFGRIAASFF